MLWACVMQAVAEEVEVLRIFKWKIFMELRHAYLMTLAYNVER